MRSSVDIGLMVAAASAFVIASLGLASGWEPVRTWYYSAAWWSYVIFADSGLHLRSGKSVLLRNPERCQLLLFSIGIWLSFEVYNLRLANWHYVELPSSRLERWAGYGVAFATVLPGLYVTTAWIEELFPGRPGRPERPPRSWSVALGPVRALLSIGLVLSFLPWLFPRYFFPLVWLGPTAFFAALNYRRGEGVLRELEAKGPGKLVRLLGAGLFCGFLWELWNYWAGAKWVYDVPFFAELKVFEMPVAGYLGFPPFAVSCREMHLAGRRFFAARRTRRARAVVFIGFLLYVAAVFAAIDRFTLRSFAS